MSRTDKTDPWWIKAKQYGHDVHHHEDGVCNYGDRDAGWRECHRDALWWHPIFRCCCFMCSGAAYGEGPKDKARKRRREGKRQARDWQKEWE